MIQIYTNKNSLKYSFKNKFYEIKKKKKFGNKILRGFFCFPPPSGFNSTKTNSRYFRN